VKRIKDFIFRVRKYRNTTNTIPHNIGCVINISPDTNPHHISEASLLIKTIKIKDNRSPRDSIRMKVELIITKGAININEIIAALISLSLLKNVAVKVEKIVSRKENNLAVKMVGENTFKKDPNKTR
jgi:hypothetical protein